MIKIVQFLFEKCATILFEIQLFLIVFKYDYFFHLITGACPVIYLSSLWALLKKENIERIKYLKKWGLHHNMKNDEIIDINFFF